MGEERIKSSNRLSMLILLGGGLLAGIVMAVLTVVGGRSVSQGGMGSERPIIPTPIPDLVGQVAPDFTARTPEGELVTLSHLRGSPVALNFWATWCDPCRAEMPELEEARIRYTDLVVLAVNAGETAEDVQAFMSELGLTFPALLDPRGEISDLYGAKFLPTTVWIDAGGVVRGKHIGVLTQALIDDYMAQVKGD